MTKHLISLAAALALATPSIAQGDTETPPSPNEIVAQAQADEWVAIAPEDLLVMTLAPDAEGNERKVVIQLMPAPFSEAWTANIRTFARSGWYDDITVNRVQDNYVVQWGDANYDNPEAEGEPKGLPTGLLQTSEDQYTIGFKTLDALEDNSPGQDGSSQTKTGLGAPAGSDFNEDPGIHEKDPYAPWVQFWDGWPIGAEFEGENPPFWPVHCYGMVGVGRNYSPDAGTGAELYTVIGHAPRHLDRNIALVGRIVEGIEHLSSLPRGKGVLGFYEDESRRPPILTVRVASDLADAQKPRFEYLSTETESFARYANARANRSDPFFIYPTGGADICNIPVPIRRVAE
ncbi:peptidylprolyl isomerase [Qipengyuania sp. 1XM1-15A]|uniref:peptidylprolyl isomerase n=1 Tax=Qipengyuania xiamenensis TaxID=2867237 RepID=UPI001C869A43|nr:peptidylprolyl isomerase [Qipengyuania xiamenensis]MBX7533557.1 peptidylprolyl isomerase [Qipengyuania xiamenensis]